MLKVSAFFSSQKPRTVVSKEPTKILLPQTAILLEMRVGNSMYRQLELCKFKKLKNIAEKITRNFFIFTSKVVAI